MQYDIGRIDCKPEEVSYASEKVQKLADYYANLVDSKRVQAAGFLMARKGKIFAHQALGSLHYQKKELPFKHDSIKHIASVTKVLTATAVMQLIEEGTLWLEQPVSSLIKEFDTPAHKEINLKHFLTHTTGLQADPGYFSEPYPNNIFEQMEKGDWIKVFLSGRPQAAPGEQWNYSSAGFCILGEVISRASGMHYTDYIQEKIFKPLKMERSFIDIPQEMLSQYCFTGDDDMQDIEECRSRDPKKLPPSGGGVSSTLYDLYRLAQCFLNGGEMEGQRILSPVTCRAMTRNQLPPGVYAYHWGHKCKDFRQGLGWEFHADGSIMDPAVFNHEGWGWTSVFVDPTEDFVFISLLADENDWDPDVMVKPRTLAWTGLL